MESSAGGERRATDQIADGSRRRRAKSSYAIACRGSGEDPQSQGKGSGSGFGMIARPVGAFIIREGELSWRPAVDVTRIVLGGQVVAVVALLTLRAILKARAKSKR